MRFTIEHLRKFSHLNRTAEGGKENILYLVNCIVKDWFVGDERGCSRRKPFFFIYVVFSFAAFAIFSFMSRCGFFRIHSASESQWEEKAIVCYEKAHNARRKQKSVVRAAHRQHWARASKGHTFLSFWRGPLCLCSPLRLCAEKSFGVPNRGARKWGGKSRGTAAAQKPALDTDFETIARPPISAVGLALTPTRGFPFPLRTRAHGRPRPRQENFEPKIAATARRQPHLNTPRKRRRRKKLFLFSTNLLALLSIWMFWSQLVFDKF